MLSPEREKSLYKSRIYKKKNGPEVHVDKSTGNLSVMLSTYKKKP